MTLLELKKVSGKTEVEDINNIFKYAICIFDINKLVFELDELYNEALIRGFRFCPDCGFFYEKECNNCKVKNERKEI